MAAAMIAEIFQLPYHATVMPPTITAQMRPFSPPTAISLNNSQRAFTHST